MAVVLARRGGLTDKKTLTLTALPTFQGLAGGTAGGGSALINPAGAAVSADGVADDGNGNKGVRDHGRGEGRDGAGQGKGKGRKK